MEIYLNRIASSLDFWILFLMEDNSFLTGNSANSAEYIHYTIAWNAVLFNWMWQCGSSKEIIEFLQRKKLRYQQRVARNRGQAWIKKEWGWQKILEICRQENLFINLFQTIFLHWGLVYHGFMGRIKWIDYIYIWNSQQSWFKHQSRRRAHCYWNHQVDLCGYWYKS